jgi:LuxR family maltose regulon positive regulatory protein
MPDSIERPELRGRIQSAIRERRLVFVQAPPAYGKSTVVAEVLAVTTLPVVRYDAAPWDTDAFVEPLVSAVRTVRPDFGRRALALAEARADARRIGHAFAADLRHVGDELLIAIEDTHLLGAAFGGFIDGLFRDAPQTVSWLLTSRTPPLFSLADFVLRDLATVFTAADLRFDRSTIATLAQRLSPDITAARIDELATRTEGWPGGVVLSLRTGRTPLAITGGSYEAASALLIEQLLQTFADDELAVLEALAVYDVIDERVIDAMPDARETRAALNRLEQRGAMIARLPTGALRAHPMLRDVIVQRITRREGSAPMEARHAQAARLYAHDNRIAAALFHLDAGADAQAIHDVLLAHGTEAIERGHGEQVARLAARLSASQIDDPALVAYLAGWRAKQRGDDRVRERFSQAADAATAAGNHQLAFSAHVEVIEHDLGRGRSVSQVAIDELRATAATFGVIARASAEIRAGWHAAIGGRFAEALASAEDAAIVNVPLLHQAAAPLRAYALTVLGRFADAERELTDLLERLQDADSLGLRARMLVWSARLALLRGDTRGAYADVLEGQRTGASLIARSEVAAMQIALAEAATHAGDAATADVAVGAATASCAAAWYEHDRARIPALAALYGARSTFLRAGARAALRQLEAHRQTDAPAVQRAMLRADAVCYARVLGEPDREQLAQAAAALEAAVPRDAADAAGLNAAAAQLATLVRCTPDLGVFGALAASLAELERRGPRFESRIAAGPGQAEHPQPVEIGPSEERLTPREAEILELLALGLTNKEIAQRLVLGTRTVETHVARILGKLGVNSRSRAIAAHIRRSTDASGGLGLL